MLIGFNNDVEYRGKEFHIQTEDHGKSTAKIESQIFHEGQILDTEIVSYDSVLEEEATEEKIDAKLKSLLEATHKGLYKRLVSGEYDEMVGLDPLEDEGDVGADPEEFEPSQDRVPNAAMQVEKEGEEAFEQFHQNEAQKHVDLDDLKSHLAERDDGGNEQEGEESAEEREEQTAAPEPDIDPEIEKADQSLTPTGAELDGGEQEAAEIPEPSEAVVESPPSQSSSEVAANSEPDASMSQPSQREVNETPGPIDELPDTGVKSWSGCEEPTGEMSIVSLVEAYLAE
jgi:hypothetical protein